MPPVSSITAASALNVAGRDQMRKPQNSVNEIQMKWNGTVG